MQYFKGNAKKELHCCEWLQVSCKLVNAELGEM